LIATHLPAGGKVEQVRATFSSVQLQSAAPQKPCCDSLEHAMYGCDVSYEMPLPSSDSCLIHWYGPATEPPWHEPIPPQFSMCCTDRLMSMPLAPRAILMRSPSADTEPCDQHEPQYWGMCWLRDMVQ